MYMMLLSISLIKYKFMNSIEGRVIWLIYTILIFMIWIRVWRLVIFKTAVTFVYINQTMLDFFLIKPKTECCS